MIDLSPKVQFMPAKGMTDRPIELNPDGSVPHVPDFRPLLPAPGPDAIPVVISTDQLPHHGKEAILGLVDVVKTWCNENGYFLAIDPQINPERVIAYFGTPSPVSVANGLGWYIQFWLVKNGKSVPVLADWLKTL